ncbi:collagen alpha-1(XIX) chain-like protein [Camelus ferus]|nr:collagen alpha-1(XIX) chain-like protein [Camelus ferus]
MRPHSSSCFLIQPAKRKVFPKGLPEEFAIAATFRVRRSTKKERWFLWQVLNQQNVPQVSIVVDGGKKVIEFMFQATEGDGLNYVFKTRELRPLFDRQWHKLGIGVQAQGISLYVDCNLVASRHTDIKDAVDFRGRTVIVARAADGKPVDVELHQLKIYCNSDIIAQESCCEISDTKCIILKQCYGLTLDSTAQSRMALDVLRHHHQYPLMPVECLHICQPSRTSQTSASASPAREKQYYRELRAHLARKGTKENRVELALKVNWVLLEFLGKRYVDLLFD